MSFEQYSPLDTTLPFFSNHQTITINNSEPEVSIPFLLKFKGICKKIRIDNLRDAEAMRIYINDDRTNPITMEGVSASTPRPSLVLDRWIKNITFDYASSSGTFGRVEVYYDVVLVEYLPPRNRV